jgi:hypothetical protein
MCSDANCQHKYNPNKPASLSTADQASLWADIKTARKALEARVAFLKEVGQPEDMLHLDPQMIKLEALTKSLWTRFRVL